MGEVPLAARNQISGDMVREFSLRADGLLEAIVNEDRKGWLQRMPGGEAQFDALEHEFAQILNARNWGSAVGRFCRVLLDIPSLEAELTAFAKSMTSYVS